MGLNRIRVGSATATSEACSIHGSSPAGVKVRLPGVKNKGDIEITANYYCTIIATILWRRVINDAAEFGKPESPSQARNQHVKSTCSVHSTMEGLRQIPAPGNVGILVGTRDPLE